MREEHKAVVVNELGCEVDEQVVELVRILNKIPWLRTTSSCQGYPGPISYAEDCGTEGGAYGFVSFRTTRGGRYMLAEFTLGDLPMILNGLEDDVGTEIYWAPGLVLEEGEKPYNGWLRFRNEAIPEVTRRVREWVGR